MLEKPLYKMMLSHSFIQYSSKSYLLGWKIRSLWKWHTGSGGYF